MAASGDSNHGRRRDNSNLEKKVGTSTDTDTGVGAVIDVALIAVCPAIGHKEDVRLRKAAWAGLRHRGSVVVAGGSTRDADVEASHRVIFVTVRAERNRPIRVRDARHAVLGSARKTKRRNLGRTC